MVWNKKIITALRFCLGGLVVLTLLGMVVVYVGIYPSRFLNPRKFINIEEKYFNLLKQSKSNRPMVYLDQTDDGGHWHRKFLAQYYGAAILFDLDIGLKSRFSFKVSKPTDLVVSFPVNSPDRYSVELREFCINQGGYLVGRAMGRYLVLVPLKPGSYKI